MGSEVVVIGYSVMAFLSLVFYFALSRQESNRASNNNGDGEVNLIDRQKSFIETEIDPITFGFKFLCVAIFFISLIGLGDGIIESYDYCSIMPVNITTVNSNLDTINYQKVCFENTNTEDLSFYKLVYMIAMVAGFLLLVGMLWQLFLLAKRFIWERVRGFFKKRR